jgi:hypothetical protein
MESLSYCKDTELRVSRLVTSRKCYITSVYEYVEISGIRERGTGKRELSPLLKEGVGTKLKLMKHFCLNSLHSANSTAHIQLEARFIWKLVIQVA